MFVRPELFLLLNLFIYKYLHILASLILERFQLHLTITSAINESKWKQGFKKKLSTYFTILYQKKNSIPELPLPPKNLRLDSRTSDSFTLSWDHVRLSESYELVVMTSPETNALNTTKDNSTTTTTKTNDYITINAGESSAAGGGGRTLSIVDNLKPDTTYWVKIRTRSLTGFGNYSQPAFEITTMRSGIQHYRPWIEFVFFDTFLVLDVYRGRFIF